MIDEILRCVRRHLAGERTAVDLHDFICLPYAKGALQGCSLILFEKDAGTPAFIAKGRPPGPALTRDGRTDLKIEIDNLARLDDVGLNDDARRTPEPAGLWEEAGVLVSLQTALPGRVMKNIPSRQLFSARTVDATIRRVFDWWRTFQERAGVQRRRLSGAAYEEAILSTVSRYERSFVIAPDEHRFLESRFGGDSVLRDVDLSFMLRHGDFCPANMVQGPGGIGVFDWEFPLEPLLPLFDLFHFFGSLRYPFRGLRGASSHYESFVAVFWGDNEVNSALRRKTATKLS